MKQEITITLNFNTSIYTRKIEKVKSSKIELKDDLVIIHYTKKYGEGFKVYLPKDKVLNVEVKYYVE